jgi:hypothetical protein
MLFETFVLMEFVKQATWSAISVELLEPTRIEPQSATPPPLLNIRHHMLDHGVVLHPIHAQVLAVAGLLEAAVGHL